MQILPLGGYGLSFNGAVLILFQKIFSGTGILPVRVHRLKTCATNYRVPCAPSIRLNGGRDARPT